MTARPSGERKQATVLFADMVGSTSLVADLDAEDAIDRLNPTISAMVRSVLKFDGEVVRTMGDGLMAVFGAPAAREEHARLACRAALAMRNAISSLSDAPSIRIGIHSGEVVAGSFNLGSELEWDARGPTVNIAQRLEQLAEPGLIYLSKQCSQLVASYFDVTGLGVRAVKGIPNPIEIYRLERAKSTSNRSRFRSDPLPQLRGRSVELVSLKNALFDAERGRGNVIGVKGSIGVGKSRLCYEFAKWCRQKTVQVLEVRAADYGRDLPLQPVLQTLRSFLGISPILQPMAARRRIERRVLALDPALADAIPLLCSLLGVEEKSLPGRDPKGHLANLRRMAARLLTAVGRKTSVLLLEDVHWFDDASLDFVETLVKSVTNTHVLLILNFRPTYAAPWNGRPYYKELPLTELDGADIEDLVSDLIGPDSELDDIRAQISARSGGNPFFAEELVRSLAQSGQLIGEFGRYLPGASLDTRNLPTTIEAAIGAHIDKLRTDEKTLLQVCATIGREFPVVILKAVCADGIGEIEGLLAHLSSATLIHERPTFAGRGFAFRHPLIQEVTYRMQLRARRVESHASIAQAIERSEWGRLDEFAGLLAHHYEAAGQLPQAIAHLQRAARWIGKTNSAEALKAWKKIRLMLHDQPRSEVNDRLRALASGQVLSFGWREGMIAEDAKPFAEEALAYARLADRAHEPILLGAYGRILAATATSDNYVELAQEAVNLTSSEGDVARFATVNGMLSQALFFAGRLSEALGASSVALGAIAAQQGFDREITLGLSVTQLLGFDIEHWIKCLRARTLVRLGRFSEAEEELAKTLQIETHRTTPITSFIPHLAYVEMAWRRRVPKLARLHAACITELAEKSAIPYLHVAALIAVGLVKSAEGELREAAGDLKEALDFVHQAKAGLEFEGTILAHLADVLYRVGDTDAGLLLSGEAIATARRRADRFAESHGCLVRASILARAPASATHEEARGLLRRVEDLTQLAGTVFFERWLAELRANLQPPPFS